MDLTCVLEEAKAAAGGLGTGEESRADPRPARQMEAYICGMIYCLSLVYFILHRA